MIRLENGNESSVGQRPEYALIPGRLSDSRSDFETERKVEGTIVYMAQHVNQPVQVSDLAALATVSSSHYFALFKRLTGFAPIDFFIRLRMSQACNYLDATAFSVKEIAAKLGYDDPFYFSRVFKSVHRVAPTEYRGLSQKSRDAIRKSVWSGAIPGGEKQRRFSLATHPNGFGFPLTGSASADGIVLSSKHKEFEPAYCRK